MYLDNRSLKNKFVRTSIVTLAICTPLFTFGEEKELKRLNSIFSPLPLKANPNSVRSAEIESLGRKLFFDNKISADNSTSCATCHSPGRYGTDNLPQSIGSHGLQSQRNSQSNLNLRFQFVTHWIGDRQNLEDQAIQAFTTPEILGHKSAKAALKKLRALKYDNDFKKIFNDQKFDLNIVAFVLAEYQRSLTTPAPFDAYLNGDLSALSTQQKKGLSTFINLGCVSCHNGPAIGGKSLQRFGITKNYWEVTGSTNKDPGRFAFTKLESDRNVFKIPSLRNVEKTAPYFHDGSAPDLQTAITWMAQLQLDRDIDSTEIENIESFLKSLTGRPPEGI